MISKLPLSSVLFCVSGIVTGNETVSPSDCLGASLDIFQTIISRLNCSPMIPLTKAFLLVIIEVLVVCSNGHENMVLHATPSPKVKETVTGCPFNFGKPLLLFDNVQDEGDTCGAITLHIFRVLWDCDW